MVTIRITDEFHMVYEMKTEDLKQASKIVNDWIMNSDETPIYEINIEFNN